jgi:Flp pilus assembly protein TadG
MANLRTRARTRGLATVEAALLFPLLLLITLGLIEYGWMFFKLQQINNAARQGARVAATYNSTNPQVQATVNTLMSAANLGTYTLAIVPINTAQPKGTQMRVTVTVAKAHLVLTGFPLPYPASIKGETVMVKEAPG